jgi:hypothetical protein
MAWFWLRAFGIPETDTNRERLLIGASVLGMALVTIGTLGVFVFGQL